MSSNKVYLRAIIVYAAYIVVLSQLQVTLPEWFNFSGSRPDLTLVLVILSGYLFGRMDGALVGLAAGFMRDMFAGRALGLGMLLLLYAGLLAALLLRQSFRRNILLSLFQVVWITVLYELVVTGVVFLVPMLPDVTYEASHLYGLMLQRLPGQIGANLLAAVPLVLLLHFMGPYRQKSSFEDNETRRHEV